MIIYTDGALATSTKQGGIAFVVIKDGEKIHSHFDGVKNTTNNRTEILAAAEAIQWLINNNYKGATIITDSMYVIGTMSMNWKRKKNIDLWLLMDELIDKVSITWKHVKGHDGDKWNEYCDTLAVHGSHLKLE